MAFASAACTEISPEVRLWSAMQRIQQTFANARNRAAAIGSVSAQTVAEAKTHLDKGGKQQDRCQCDRQNAAYSFRLLRSSASNSEWRFRHTAVQTVSSRMLVMP